jgi:hypothetical protein
MNNRQGELNTLADHLAGENFTALSIPPLIQLLIMPI